jgi:hypothetical protein
MLKELAAVSEEAKREADRAPGAAAPESVPTGGAERIRTLVGPLTTPRMELAARPAAALIDDKTSIVPVLDEELTSARSDLMLLSTDSVFTLYQRSAASPVAAPAAESQAVPEPSSPAAQPTQPAAPPASGARPNPLFQRQAEPPAVPAPVRQQPPAMAAPAKGSGRMVDVGSTPAGSLVVFDNDPSISCVAPCQIALAPGRHTLNATLAGHRVAQKIVTVDDKKASSVTVDMVAKEGWLTVESQIAGSPVFVNGKKTENLTPARLKLAEGEYVIGVEVEGVLKTQTVVMKDTSLMRISLE